MPYTGNAPKDLDLTTPDGASEYGNVLDDAIIETKRVFKYTQAINTLTTDTTLGVTHSFILANKATAIALTLPAAGTVASSTFTKEYRIRNIGVGNCTISGTVTMNGAATVNPVLSQHTEIYLWTDGTTWYGMRFSDDNIANCVVMTTGTGEISVPVENATTATQLTDGTNNIRTKIINIGDWNMDSTQLVNVAHGLTWTDIRNVSANIRDDTNAVVTPLFSSDGINVDGSAYWSTTNVTLYRRTSGGYDGTGYNSTSFNRGWITITYVV